MNVNLELTDHCNIRCTMCSQSMRDEAHGVPMRFMAFSTWRQGLLGLDGLPEVALCPHWLGEPTLHPEFEAFVEYAFAVNRGNRLFRSFKVHTNAVILPPARAERLLRLARSPGLAPDTFQAVHFSIDAFGESTYRLVKGADHRDKVFRNVERFLTLRGAQPWPVAHVAFVVQPGNQHDVVPFVAHWRALLTRLGRPFRITGEWPGFDQDAIYLRRLNTGDQPAADRLHAEALRQVGLDPQHRRPGSF